MVEFFADWDGFVGALQPDQGVDSVLEDFKLLKCKFNLDHQLG